MSDPVVIVQLRQTCDDRPSQWEGLLEDGRYIYIRFRHGELSAGVGFYPIEAVENSAGWNGTPWFYSEPDTGRANDGYMTTEEMLTWTGFTLQPAAAGPKEGDRTMNESLVRSGEANTEVLFKCKCSLELRAAFCEGDESDIVHCPHCKRPHVVSCPVVIDIYEVYEHVRNDN